MFALLGSLSAATLPRALWVWDATPITDTEKRQQLFALSQRHGIATLFIHTGSLFLARAQAANHHPVSAEQLAAFNQAAHALGLQVHALDGDPSQCLEEGHASALATHHRAIAFNATQTVPSARLDGFQWDIEPHALPEWTGNPAGRPDYLRGFLEVSRKILAASREASTPLPPGFATAFWLDNAEFSLTYQNATKPAAFHLLDLLAELPGAYLALMAYRDFVSGSNGTLALVEGELAYAAVHAPTVRIWIGQETENFEPPHITFYQEGPAALDAAIRQLSTALAGNPRVAGVAIHHYASYRDLLAAQPALGDRRLAIEAAPAAGEVVLRFTRAARDRCTLETASSLAVPSDWRALASYDPATLTWSTAPGAGDPAPAFTETLRDDGLVAVTAQIPPTPGALARFFRVHAD